MTPTFDIRPSDSTLVRDAMIRPFDVNVQLDLGVCQVFISTGDPRDVRNLNLNPYIGNWSNLRVHEPYVRKDAQMISWPIRGDAEQVCTLTCYLVAQPDGNITLRTLLISREGGTMMHDDHDLGRPEYANTVDQEAADSVIERVIAAIGDMHLETDAERDEYGSMSTQAWDKDTLIELSERLGIVGEVDDYTDEHRKMYDFILETGTSPVNLFVKVRAATREEAERKINDEIDDSFVIAEEVYVNDDISVSAYIERRLNAGDFSLYEQSEVD